jgi:hypothetical protein
MRFIRLALMIARIRAPATLSLASVCKSLSLCCRLISQAVLREGCGRAGPN